MNPILEAVAARRRRHVLAVLRDRTSPVSEQELATHVVAMEREQSPTDVTNEEVSRVRLDLVHAQLPKLAAASLVERDAETATVTTTDHPALEDPHFWQLVETDADEWDDVIANLASRSRRVVLSVLEARESMTRTDLAHEVCRRAVGTEADQKALETSLHHVHLPKLAEAGLVAYDPEDETATYEGHPELDEAWLDCTTEEMPHDFVSVARSVSDV